MFAGRVRLEAVDRITGKAEVLAEGPNEITEEENTASTYPVSSDANSGAAIFSGRIAGLSGNAAPPGNVRVYHRPAGGSDTLAGTAVPTEEDEEGDTNDRGVYARLVALNKSEVTFVADLLTPASGTPDPYQPVRVDFMRATGSNDVLARQLQVSSWPEIPSTKFLRVWWTFALLGPNQDVGFTMDAEAGRRLMMSLFADGATIKVIQADETVADAGDNDTQLNLSTHGWIKLAGDLEEVGHGALGVGVQPAIQRPMSGENTHRRIQVSPPSFTPLDQDADDDFDEPATRKIRDGSDTVTSVSTVELGVRTGTSYTASDVEYHKLVEHRYDRALAITPGEDFEPIFPIVEFEDDG